MLRENRPVAPAALALVLSLLWLQTPAVTIAVNGDSLYQTIEGIGVAQNPATFTSGWKYKSGPFFISVNLDSIRFFDTTVVDGGFTGMRADPVTAFQATQGDFSVTGGVRAEIEAEAKFVAAARRSGEPFWILWNCFSPPAWMKANNSQVAVGGTDANNYLLASHYSDFASHWIRLLQIARDTFGVTVDAISLQNEPLFDEPYVSCNYSHGPGCGWNGVCYNQMFRVVAPLIHAAFPSLKIVASEDLNRTTVETNLRSDAVSNPLVHAWATHNDYVTSFAYWPDRPIWNTEPHSMGFLDEARMCLDNLAAGAGVWLTGANGGRTNGNCDTAGTNSTDCMKRGVYSSLKMFARYVRPGARRVKSSGGVSNSYEVIAFRHLSDACLTIVLINNTAVAEPATLSVTGPYQPAQFSAFYSTATQDEVPAGTVAVNGTYTMPAYSVSTLVAGTYRGTPTAVASPATRAPGVRAAARFAAATRYYTVSGRRIVGPQARAHGLFVCDRPWRVSALR